VSDLYIIKEETLSAIADGVRNMTGSSEPVSPSQMINVITNAESNVISMVEPATDDIPKVFIDGIIPTTKNAVLAELTYISKTLTFHSYIEIKCQGNSSMSYPKKNFTIKLFEDADRSVKQKIAFKNWGKQNKFCLKANWIDISHLRNIVSA
jgi:hypothetical protein